MTSAFAAKLHLPPQDLEAPSLFAPRSDALNTWLDALPKADLGQCIQSLYKAVSELNRVRLSPLLRLQLLEALRPAAYVVSKGLRRHYLNQPNQLPEQAQKIAHISHALHEQLALGYTLAAADAAQAAATSGLSPAQQAPAIATALHRAIAEHSQNLLRDLLLYRPAHPGCWFTLHQLAKFAREFGVIDSAVEDPQCGSGSIENIYVRALLIGSAGSNQLRQESILAVFERALGWATAARLTASSQGILLINDNGDSAPIYREHAGIDSNPGWHGLDTTHLVRKLLNQCQSAEAGTLNDPQLTPELLGHLAQIWTAASTRSFNRTPVQEQVEICIGLTATHFFVAGGREFNTLIGHSGRAALEMQNENPFLRRQQSAHAVHASHTAKDVWDLPYAPQAGVEGLSLEKLEHEILDQKHDADMAMPPLEREKFRSETVARIDISPNGLCIVWPVLSKSLLRGGEVIGLREVGASNWSIGVVRWNRQTDAGMRLGIQLLSPSALPCGARPITKTGAQGDYLRALVLPALKQIGQPTTLLVPRLPFRVGQKVSLLSYNKESRVQLTRKLVATAAFNQFEFRRLNDSADANLDQPDTLLDTL